MAIIKLGELVAGIRGTVGGTTYSENLGGPYCKGWSMPTNPRTHKQSLHRGRISTLAAAWRGLTIGQRTGWDTFAADPAQELENSLGEAYYISGFGWFVKCNSRLMFFGQSYIATAPVAARPGTPNVTSMYYKVDPPFWCKISYPAATWDPDFWCQIFCAVRTSRGAKKMYSGYYHIRSMQAPPGTDFYPHAQFTPVFGEPQSGWSVQTRVYTTSTEGLRSAAWTEWDVIV